MTRWPARAGVWMLPAIIWLIGAQPHAVAAPPGPPVGELPVKLVFGSFRDPVNARAWARETAAVLEHDVGVERIERDGEPWFRVAAPVTQAEDFHRVSSRAREVGLSFWRWFDHAPVAGAGIDDAERAHGVRPNKASMTEEDAPVAPVTRELAGPLEASPGSPVREERCQACGRTVTAEPERGAWAHEFEFALQSRSFAQSGWAGQRRHQPSVSLRWEFERWWDEDRRGLRFVPFVRADVEDSQRTHADLREGYWTTVGSDWELSVGVKQVFWGVTEFAHLVDVINQTDLVENIDAEDKLGQPMVHLSFVREWGIVDLFALTGFRERTFPGSDGRFRPLVRVDTDAADYESGARRNRLDAAVRWSHHLGPFNFGVYHFSGTSRDPELLLRERRGEVVLQPYYRVIDQTGLDVQAIAGDWAFKLEAIARSGMHQRYHAAVAGFERTLVGVFGTRADLGLVAEYLYDERGDAALDTLFERDIALGARWQFNDVADSQALLGLIWDPKTDEYLLSLEAQRRLGDAWQLALEARLFGGARQSNTALTQLLNESRKSVALQRDDVLQLELTHYF